MLPVKGSQPMRPANAITRPNHILWTMKSGAEVKKWFKENFARLNFDDLVPEEEWERFAKAEGLAFPPCQLCPGLVASSENDECGVVLLGDAAHAFSPDCGQGINAGLMDVVRFNETLSRFSIDESTKPDGGLGRALREYERIQAPEVRDDRKPKFRCLNKIKTDTLPFSFLSDKSFDPNRKVFRPISI